MAKCKKCGHINDDKTVFCDNCGNRIVKVISITPKEQDHKSTKIQRPRPILFTIVLAFNYFTALIIGLASALVLFIAIIGLFTPSAFSTLNLTLLLLGGILLVVSFLYFYLTRQVQNCNNNARIIMLILLAGNLLISLILLNYIGIIISVFEIAVLAFFQDTVKLFKTSI